MGLGQFRGLAATTIRSGMLPTGMALVSLVFELAGNSGRQVLRFDRTGVGDGELWRLLTGHFAHLGWWHLLLNLAGLFLVWLLVGRQFAGRWWLFVLAMTVAGIDLGFWALDSELDWYVGLSGLLHGMLAAGLLAGVVAGSREAAVLALVIAVKLLWEQMIGPLPGSEDLAGASVIVNAHLYGAIAGSFAGTIAIRVRGARSI